MEYKLLHLTREFPELAQGDADPTLEAYLLSNLGEMGRQEQKRPCILLCPGGAYAFCSRREAEPIAVHFLPEGYQVFILTYSTAPHRFPTQLRQVAAALELIHRNAEAWHCDTERIALMGFSAGGHLAASYATRYDCAQVRSLFPESKAVAASILCYPLITADWDFTHRDSMTNLLGHRPDPAETAFFSNENHVTPHTPPAFLWHTAADGAVPVKNSLVYAQALAAQGVPFELHVYPQGDHGLSTCDEQTCDSVDAAIAYDSAWLPALKRWLKACLG